MAGRYSLINTGTAVQPTAVTQPQQEEQPQQQPWMTRAANVASDILGGGMIKVNKDVNYYQQQLEQKGPLGKIGAGVLRAAFPASIITEAIPKVLPEQYTPQLFAPLSEAPTVKKLAGDLGMSALELGTLGTAGQIKAGTYLTEKTAPFMAKNVMKVSPQFGKYIPSLSRGAETLVNRAVTNGLLGAGFITASDIGNNKSVKEIAKDLAWGIPATMAGGEVINAAAGGVGVLAKIGMSKTQGYFSKMFQQGLTESVDATTKSVYKRFAEKFGEFGGKDVKEKMYKFLGNTDAEKYIARELLNLHEKKSGYDFTKIKNYIATNGKTYTGEAAKKMAEFDYYKYGRNPFSKVKELATGAVDLTERKTRDLFGQVLKRLGPDSPKALQLQQMQKEGLLTQRQLSQISNAVGFGKGGSLEPKLMDLTPKELVDLGFKEVGIEGVTRGIKTKKAGKYVDFSTQMERGEWAPHPTYGEFDIDNVLKDGWERDAAIQQIITDNEYYFNNPDKAVKYVDDMGKIMKKTATSWQDNEVINDIVREKKMSYDEAVKVFERDFNPTKKKKPSYASSLEEAREANIKLYKPNPKDNFFTYIDSAVQRFNFMDNFGGYNPNKPSETPYFKNIGERIKALGSSPQNNKRKEELLSDLEHMSDVILSKLKTDDKYSKWMGAFDWTASLKLTGTQMLQVAQAINNSAFTTDLHSTTKAIVKAFSDIERKKVLRSGVGASDLIIDSLLPGAKKVPKFWLKYTGMIGADRLARIVNGLASEEYLNKKLPDLLKNPKDLFERSEFSRFGVDPDKIIKQGKITFNDLLEGRFGGAAKGQFLSTPGDLPGWATTSGFGKQVAKFKSFGFQQMNLVDTIRDDWSKGGKFRKKAIKNIIVLTTLMPTTTAVISGLRGWITGSNDPLNPFKRYMENLMDNLGTPSEFYNSIKYGEEPIHRALEPVGLSSVEDIYNVGSAIGTDIGKIATGSKVKKKTPEALIDATANTLGLNKKRFRQLGKALGVKTTVPQPRTGEGNIAELVQQFTKK